MSDNSHEANPDYCGVYIGNTNTNETSLRKEKENSGNPGESNFQEFQLQTQDVGSKWVTENTGFGEENIIAIVHEPGLSDITTRIINNLIQAPKNYFDYYFG